MTRMWRPVGFSVWWVIGRLSPTDGTLAHAVCIALLAAEALLVVPALRRCGVRRGTATAAAILFAASPVLFEAVAWPSNLYAHLSIGFALAAVATLPRVPRLGGMVLPTLLATASYLSKEDTIALPALAALAGARFRWKRLPSWALASVALLVPDAAITAIRLTVFGTLPLYVQSPPAEILARGVRGIRAALADEPLAAWFVPIRSNDGAARPALVAALHAIPILLLGAGAPSAAARAGLLRGLLFSGIALTSFVPFLPIRLEFAETRYLELVAVGIALAAASLAAGIGWLPPRGRWLVVATLVAVFVGIERWNFRAWRAAGEAVREFLEATVPLVRDAPPNAVVLAYGQTESIEGAPALMNATPYAIQTAIDRPDLNVYPAYFAWGERGAIDRILDGKAPADLQPATKLAAAGSVRFDFAPGSPSRGATRVFDAVASEAPAGMLRVSTHLGFGSVLLPPLEAPLGASLRVAVTGTLRIPDADAPPIPVFATQRRGERWRRDLVPFGGALKLAPDATVVRLEFLVAPKSVLELRAVDVSVVSP
ncbi:MAG TPA: hypothetical protein VKE69_03600 [Planctomycetota bacterium]|nr:hypothetical protein [Planctomycetota bacterium]